MACEELRRGLRGELGRPLGELGRIQLGEGASRAPRMLSWPRIVLAGIQPGLALVHLARGESATAAAGSRTRWTSLDGSFEGAATGHRPAARAAARRASRDRDRGRRSRSSPCRGRRAGAGGGPIPEQGAGRRGDPGSRTVRLAEGDAADAERCCSEPHARGTISARRTRRRSRERCLAEALRPAAGRTAPLSSSGGPDVLERIEAARGQRDDAETQRLPPRGRLLVVVFEGRTARVRDLKGLRYLARLLADPGREFHVLDLVAGETGRPTALGPTRAGRDARRDAPRPGLPPTARRDRRRHRAGAGARRRRAGGAGRRRARLPGPRARARGRPRRSRSARRIRLRTCSSRRDPRRPPGDSADRRAPSPRSASTSTTPSAPAPTAHTFPTQALLRTGRRDVHVQLSDDRTVVMGSHVTL